MSLKRHSKYNPLSLGVILNSLLSLPTSIFESNFRRWYWLLVPLLAIVAYITVVRIGYLGDDFTLIAQAEDRQPTFGSLLPAHGNFLYRPLGLLIIWDLGVRLWGYNPFPLHVQGLLFHALTALALGLWAAEVTGRRALGLLAGALFAVFPLHLEAVGWLAAQWDALATMFGILGLWVFSLWWRKRGWPLYSLSLLLYVLALFTKDSLVTFLPLFALSAWLLTPRPGQKDLLRVSLALVPFAGVLALNLGLRLAVWGNLGGYPGVPTDYGNFFWDNLIQQIHGLLSPINTLVLGNTVAQAVGALLTVGLLVGITLYGRKWLRLLLVAGAWVLLAIVPVLNLPIKLDDLQQNRLLYLASAGYCVLVAALLYSAVVRASRLRILKLSLLGVLLLLCIAASWAQLRTWHTATVQANELNQELARLIPPPSAPRPNGMTWYLEAPPREYKGAYLMDVSLPAARHALGLTDVPSGRSASPATDAPLASDPYDAFALNFKYSPEETRFHANYVAGITAAAPPPTPQDGADGLLVWNFTDCASGAVASWRVQEAEGSCKPGPNDGLLLSSRGSDPELWGPPLGILPVRAGARFVRLRVSARYPSNPNNQTLHSQWFWAGENEKWSEADSQTIDIRQMGVPHIYWTFIPAENAGDTISSLRLDPVDWRVDAAIQWIAVDMVK